MSSLCNTNATGRPSVPASASAGRKLCLHCASTGAGAQKVVANAWFVPDARPDKTPNRGRGLRPSRGFA